jgi:hypothetical protein
VTEEVRYRTAVSQYRTVSDLQIPLANADASVIGSNDDAQTIFMKFNIISRKKRNS